MEGKNVILLLLAGAVGGMVAQVFLNMLPPLGLPNFTANSTLNAKEVRIIGANGKVVASLGATPDGSALVLADNKGHSRVIMATDKEMGPSVRFCHLDGKARAWMSVDNKGLPSTGVRTEDGRHMALLEVSPSGKPGVVLRSRNKLRAVMCVSEVGPSFNIIDDDGMLRAVIGHTAVKVKNRAKDDVTSAGSMTLFDKAGHVIWRAPEFGAPYSSADIPGPAF